MIANSIQCKTALVQLTKEFPKDLQVQALDQADWSFLAQLYTALHLFYNFTKLVSEGGVTICIVQSVYHDLATHIQKVSAWQGEYRQYDSRIVDAFKSQTVQDKFAKYKAYVDECPIYLITSILDP